MDHNEAVRQRTTERYLLDELDPDLRDQFEEHLFDCQDCAADVRAAAMFIEQSKSVLSENPEAAPARVPVPVPAPSPWLAWLRPAFAVPVFAMLLAVIGYQNLVTLPQLASAIRPQVFAAASINLKTYGSTPSPLKIHSGAGFVLNVIVPPDVHYASYRADLHKAGGGVELSLPISSAAEDTWTIGIPGSNRQGGTYNLVMYGVAADGTEKEVGRGSFELQIQD